MNVSTLKDDVGYEILADKGSEIFSRYKHEDPPALDEVKQYVHQNKEAVRTLVQNWPELEFAVKAGVSNWFNETISKGGVDVAHYLLDELDYCVDDSGSKHKANPVRSIASHADKIINTQEYKRLLHKLDKRGVDLMAKPSTVTQNRSMFCQLMIGKSTDITRHIATPKVKAYLDIIVDSDNQQLRDIQDGEKRGVFEYALDYFGRVYITTSPNRHRCDSLDEAAYIINTLLKKGLHPIFPRHEEGGPVKPVRGRFTFKQALHAFADYTGKQSLKTSLLI